MSGLIPTNCWICGGSAETREHKTKRSDLRDVFGKPTRDRPLFYSDDKTKNRRVGGFNSKILKSPIRICGYCNSTRTQPHDRAWERLSGDLRTRIKANALGAVVRANRIFPYDTRRMMLNAHLYFVKLFGCHILEGKIPINIAPFAVAILNGKQCPFVYLKFGQEKVGTGVGMSDIETQNHGGKCAFASWLYCVDGLAVNVMFAAEGEWRDGLIDAWHPRIGSNKLVIEDCR